MFMYIMCLCVMMLLCSIHKNNIKKKKFVCWYILKFSKAVFSSGMLLSYNIKLCGSWMYDYVKCDREKISFSCFTNKKKPSHKHKQKRTQYTGRKVHTHTKYKNLTVILISSVHTVRIFVLRMYLLPWVSQNSYEGIFGRLFNFFFWLINNFGKSWVSLVLCTKTIVIGRLLTMIKLRPCCDKIRWIILKV